MGRDAAADRVDVSVLVPIRNEQAHIREAFDSMRAQRFNGTIEFLLVDGRSEDGTRAILDEIAAADERVQVLDNPGRTTPSALNVGLRAARGEYVVRMDAHAYYPPVYVSGGVERLRRGDVDWVSGPAIATGGGPVGRAVSLALGSWLGAGGSRKWSGSTETEMDTGVFAGVWLRSTLERHGGWDEGWPANQDSELAARVFGEGGRIVCLPEMAARYTPRNSLRGLARQYFRYGYYREKTACKHPHSLRRSHLLPPALVIAAVAALGSRRLRRPAMLVLALYTGAVVGESARIAAGESGDAGAETEDAAPYLPLVFATMHASWGVGFLTGCARFGPPMRALARIARPG
jgi:glycosyltransferase involved in cell wall biosynthesis